MAKMQGGRGSDRLTGSLTDASTSSATDFEIPADCKASLKLEISDPIVEAFPEGTIRIPGFLKKKIFKRASAGGLEFP